MQRKSMRTADRLTAVLFVAASVYMIYETTLIETLSYQILSSRLFPYITFIFIILLALALLASTFVRSTEIELVDGYWRRIVNRRRLITLGLFCLYLALMPVVGFLPASAGFILVTIAVLSPSPRRDIPIAIALAGGVVGIIYLVFVYWLQVFLP